MQRKRLKVEVVVEEGEGVHPEVEDDAETQRPADEVRAVLAGQLRDHERACDERGFGRHKAIGSRVQENGAEEWIGLVRLVRGDEVDGAQQVCAPDKRQYGGLRQNIALLFGKLGRRRIQPE